MKRAIQIWYAVIFGGALIDRGDYEAEAVGRLYRFRYKAEAVARAYRQRWKRTTGKRRFNIRVERVVVSVPLP